MQQLLYWCKCRSILPYILTGSTSLHLRNILCAQYCTHQNLDSIAFTFMIIFQCHPISYAWNRDLKDTCVDYNAASWASAGFNILQDILIVLLPIPELRILQLSARKKIGVHAMFGLGLVQASSLTSTRLSMPSFLS